MKSYAIIKAGKLDGYVHDVDLDPRFLSSEESDGYEYREIDPALKGKDLKFEGDVVLEDDVKKARKDKKNQALGRLRALDLSGPLGNSEAVIKDLVEALLK
jgi:hypothetical protein